MDCLVCHRPTDDGGRCYDWLCGEVNLSQPDQEAVYFYNFLTKFNGWSSWLVGASFHMAKYRYRWLVHLPAAGVKNKIRWRDDFSRRYMGTGWHFGIARNYCERTANRAQETGLTLCLSQIKCDTYLSSVVVIVVTDWFLILV